MSYPPAASTMTAFFDQQDLRDLLSDSGDPVAAADLASNTTLTTLLQAACGRLEAACTVSQLYSSTDISGLTGNSAALRDEIICKLAGVMAVRRRPEKYSSDYWKAVHDEAEEYLDRLRKGERLFGLAAQQQAGLPTIDGPSAVDMQQLNLITTRAPNYFPSVASRLPIGRG